MSLSTDTSKSAKGKVNILQDVVLMQRSELPENIVDFLTEFQVEPLLSLLPEETVMVTAPRPECSRMEDFRSTTFSSETNSTSKDAKKGSKSASKRVAASGSDDEFAALQPAKKRVSAAKSKQMEPKVKPKQSELRKYMKMWDETNPYRQPPMTSTLWRAPSTLDTTISKSKTVKTKKQPPTAPQMPSAASNIEAATTSQPPMPVPNVQGATSDPPSGSEVELPLSQRSCNLVDDVLKFGRICRERKTKLLVIRGSDERLAEIATRKRRFVVRQVQLVEQKRRLLAELAEVKPALKGEVRTSSESTRSTVLREIQRIGTGSKSTKLASGKALQRRIKKGVDDVAT